MTPTRRIPPVKNKARPAVPSTRGFTWLAAVALGLVFWGSVIACIWHVATAPKIELPAPAASLTPRPEPPASAPPKPGNADE